ncbi:MAG: glycosyltransferase [Endozoicomonadaceae bacterium]|nr:glycosyltransferase [Endozoicomonadaceae bacterium]
MAIDLKQLPAPPSGKTGWPWTEESSILPKKGMPKEGEWPRISIVTPSYNQGCFIEETIRSVLLQNYPNLEYIIIDGASTDETVDIIKKYESWLTYWISEQDSGQSEAINKGLKKAAGEIVGWLNSDDFYVKNGLQILVNASEFSQGIIAWAGICEQIDKNGKSLSQKKPKINNELSLAFGDWDSSAYIPQPACLFRHDAFNKVNGIKEYLNFAMDVDLWLQLSKIGRFQQINQIIAVVRIYPEAKSCRLDPLELLEIIFINLQENNAAIARKRIPAFVRRYMLYVMTQKEFVLITCTWLYRKLIKSPALYFTNKFF